MDVLGCFWCCMRETVRESSSEGLLFWAKSDLAQASRSLPSESSQSATVNGLAQTREPSLSETVLVA